MARSEAYDQHPQHKITVALQPGTTRAYFGERLVAESDRALCMQEGRYDAVFYFPPEDVRMADFAATDHSTHCPFKGDASYWSLTGEAKGENVAWGYKTPFDQVAEIRDHLAFYPDRVRVETAD